MANAALRVNDSQVRSAATNLDSATTGLESVANAHPASPFAGSLRVSDAISNALAVQGTHASMAALGTKAAADAARNGLDELDAAEQALLTALA